MYVRGFNIYLNDSSGPMVSGSLKSNENFGSCDVRNLRLEAFDLFFLCLFQKIKAFYFMLLEIYDEWERR